MRYFLVLMVFLLLTSACKKKVDSTGPIIPGKQMAAILVDFQLTEAALFQASQQQPNIRPLADQYYATILKKHGITLDQFNESMAYYRNHLDKLQLIYEEVQDSLTELRLKTR